MHIHFDIGCSFILVFMIMATKAQSIKKCADIFLEVLCYNTRQNMPTHITELYYFESNWPYKRTILQKFLHLNLSMKVYFFPLNIDFYARQ